VSKNGQWKPTLGQTDEERDIIRDTDRSFRERATLAAMIEDRVDLERAEAGTRKAARDLLGLEEIEFSDLIKLAVENGGLTYRSCEVVAFEAEDLLFRWDVEGKVLPIVNFCSGCAARFVNYRVDTLEAIGRYLVRPPDAYTCDWCRHQAMLAMQQQPVAAAAEPTE